MATPRKLIPRERWSRATERSSMQPRDGHLADASHCFDEILSPAEQLRAAREIVTTRSAELTRAFENVVLVIAGRKKQRRRSGEGDRLTKTPCVVLVVREKWNRAQDKRNSHESIPKRLLTYTVHNGERLLCAVPTDVQHELDLYGVAPQAARAVLVSDSQVDPEMGAIACAVELQGGGGTSRFVLGARHVFSPIPELVGSIKGNLPYAQLLSAANPPGAPQLGATASYGGLLASSDQISFDVQLASVPAASWARVKQMLGGMKLSATEPFIASRERFEEVCLESFFEILVPDNHPDANMKPRKTLSAAWDTTLEEDFSFPYPVRINGKRSTCLVSHWELLRLSIANGRSTLPGDSGSPVVWWRDDGTCTLVGMHIAGKEGESISLAIPSWQLFDVDNYLQLPGAAAMKPVNL